MSEEKPTKEELQAGVTNLGIEGDVVINPPQDPFPFLPDGDNQARTRAFVFANYGVTDQYAVDVMIEQLDHYTNWVLTGQNSAKKPEPKLKQRGLKLVDDAKEEVKE